MVVLRIKWHLNGLYFLPLLFRPTFVSGNEFENINSNYMADTTFNCTGGTYLSDEVCVPKGYDNTKVPDKIMTVLTDFNWPNFREVDDKKMTITFDILILYTWRDNRIRKKFVGQITPINNKYFHTIWSPSVYIEHLKSYRQRDSNQDKLMLEQTNIHNLKFDVLPSGANKNNIDYNNTFVTHRIEAQIILYCDFTFSTYSMDTHVCISKLESPTLDEDQLAYFKYPSNWSVCLKINDQSRTGNALQGFEVVTNCYQDDGAGRTLKHLLRGREMGSVAFNITLARVLRPFLMKYYLPSIVITL